MTDLSRTLALVAVMAVTTYLIRMLPMVLIRKKLQNPFLQSFLYYVPYAVLAAMTIPAIFTSTGSVPSAVCGLAAALVTAARGKSLLPVALAACGAVLLAEVVLHAMA